MTAAIVVNDLSADYRTKGTTTHALRGVSFDVQPGEILGVLGESGSGKTTLARILAGTMRRKGPGGFEVAITGGDATVHGTSLRSLSKRELNRLTFQTGFLEQDANARLDRMERVRELITAPIYARSKRYPREVAAQRAAQLMDAVQLPLALLESYPYQLSDGQRQRVAIAQSLVLGPTALIADEPTAGIDVTVRDAVVSVFNALRGDPEFAAVVITHDVAVLRRLRATVAVMHRGTIVGYGDVNEVFRKPTHPYVAKLAEALELDGPRS